MLDSSALSPRERQIAESYAAGRSYQEIAAELHIAPSTVRTHLAAIYRKLEVSSKLELHQALEGARPQAAVQTDHAAIISELALSLEEAISRENALGEVLRIISGSDGKVDHVIAAVLGYALRLCDAEFGILFSYASNKGFRATNMKGIPVVFQDWWQEQGDYKPAPHTAIGRLERSHDIVNILDVRAEGISQTDDPLRRATIDLGGARSFVAIPMLAGTRLIGAFTIYRQTLRPFDDRAVQLARIFADQSVIAIENARLMSALRSNNGPEVSS
ncbi:MAG: LuxR C-terminal-related transcriptional regulator [Arenibacterium sp.]